MKKAILLLTIINFFCFINKTGNAQSNAWIWAKSAGGTTSEWGKTVAVDVSGNVYIAGSFSGSTLILGNDTLINAGTGVGNADIFLAKYDANGNVLWARSAGGTNSDMVNSMAVDNTGDIYITGAFQSPTITFGSFTFTRIGYYDVYLAKYDPNGNVIWANNGSGAGTNYVSSMALDGSGNVYITGSYSYYPITFGTLTLNNSGAEDIFLVKYDTGGNVIWAKSAGASSFEYAYSVSTDKLGNIYLGGDFYGASLSIGAFTLTNTNSTGNFTDLFLAKYDAGGEVLWAKSFGGESDEYTASLATDSIGNTSFSAYFSSQTVHVGTEVVTNTGINASFDIILARFDNNGNILWAKGAGGENEEVVNSAEIDNEGNTYITGWFNSNPLSFGQISIENAGVNDIFLAKYNSSGNVIWAKSLGGTASDKANSIKLGNSEMGYITGVFNSSSLLFGNYTILNAGASDIFLAKFNTQTMNVPGSGSNPGILIYPNPAKDRITIETFSNISKCTLTICTINGQELIKQQINENMIQLDISKLSSGIYIAKIITDNTVTNSKIIKE